MKYSTYFVTPTVTVIYAAIWINQV